MNKILLALFTLVALESEISAQAVSINPALLAKPWTAFWITCPGVARREYGVFHFRKNLNLQTKPTSFIVHVSADNRYRLFINGQSVCFGPARGDLYNWYFETIDIASYLKPGANTIAATVWNMGTLAPVAQVSNQTAFVLQGDSEKESIVNTNASWKVIMNASYKPCSINNGERLKTYMVIGPGDEVDAALYPWGWEETGYNDNNWQQPQVIANPVAVGLGTDNLWTLTPRNIPMMEEYLQRLSTVRRTTGVQANNNFIMGKGSLTIPANTKATILLDQAYNTVAYPQLQVSGGKESVVTITYAEALMKGGIKGNRDNIEGKTIAGNYDVFKPDGGIKRWFKPLWLRTYRYVQLDIETGKEPLTIDDFYGMYTGYPFQQLASFSSNDTSLQRIWDTGWRTARLCAGETYYDCPYYEQLQYEGDTRIQSLISLYVSGDDRLMRKALLDFYYSRIPEGLTQGRYPSNRLQVIPPFSLFWVSMLYDYWMHRKDDQFLQTFLLPVEGVLKWYENHVDHSKNMLGDMPWWNFTDWNTAFNFGVPDGADNGNSSIVTLQYAYTLRQAGQLFEYFGKGSIASHYKKLADDLCAGSLAQCFDQQKGLMANTPEKKSFSQHAGIMSVITAAVPTDQMKTVMQKVLQDTSLSQATFYYRFYLTLALKQAGMGDMYYEQLAPWREMLKNGLTTFAENPDPARSDCHAWSASPNYDFFATICGIMPASPGFSSVLIQPSLGALKKVQASMPHPLGTISIRLTRKGAQGVNGKIILPQTVGGHFLWKEKTIALRPGENIVEL